MFLLLLINLLSPNLKGDLQQIHLIAQLNPTKALTLIEKTLQPLKDHPATGGTISLYRRLSQKQKQNPVPFLKKLLRQKTTPRIRERIYLTLGEYYQSLGLKGYYYGIYYYELIAKNPAENSRLIDEALWNQFLIYQKIKAYRAALKILNKIIATETYALYTGSYNHFHLYDAYMEKAHILKIYDQQKKRLKLLKRFVTKYNENDRRPEALYKLCIEGKIKKYCHELKRYRFNRYNRRLKKRSK